jgi:quinol monooxygenase YgiN
VRSYQVLRDHDSEQRIVHLSRWTSLSAAKAFFHSPELEMIRDQAGVTSPEFLYLDQLEGGTL